MYLLIISEPIEELVDMAYAEKGRCIEVVQNLSKHLQGQSETRNDGFNKKTSSHHL
jgi:diadenosine tetraphosphate (Ap4A) HIT family hydrolase